MGTTLKKLEGETQRVNRTELAIRIVEEATPKDHCESGSLIVLWDYCMERRALICQATSSCFSYMDLIHTLQRLVLKLIFRTCAILNGMSGCITEISWLPTHFRRSVLDDVLDLQRMKVM
jgi:hypothetical protein